MATIDDVSKYLHSPAHKAVITRDYASLRRILSSLPRLHDPAEIKTEATSIAEEAKADSISAIIDRRDVPNRDTPLHLAVKLGDEASAEMLMEAGADWSLQNEQGWSALQEAICSRKEGIAMCIVRHYQPLAWAKWCRRLPRLVSTMHRMRDFYMEITFHFESSVIPFVSRIAPSDTCKIWKRGANLRADMTLAGFDGFRIQRSDQSIMFLGDGSEDGRIPPGSLCVISHKEKEMMNALEGAGTPASEAEVSQEVAAMSKTSIFRPGIDVSQAMLFPQMTWRRQEKTEMVGQWKAKVYDMHNVVVSIKSRSIPGAMTEEEIFSNSARENETETETETEDDLEDILTEDEKKQLELAIQSSSPESSNQTARLEKKEWFSGWRRRDTTKHHEGNKRNIPPRSSLSADEKASDETLTGGGEITPARHSVGAAAIREGSRENEYKKGLRPVLWLSESFPLQTRELLPLLDILANKVKAIRRLRELLTTKLPSGTFPVKVAIPVVPTIRVLVTFTKFEELQPIEDEFVTPPSSPDTPYSVKNSSKAGKTQTSSSSSSWFQWMKTPDLHPTSSSSGSCSISKAENEQVLFVIPRDYKWVTAEEKRKKMQEKNNARKGKNQKS
ncbi:PREDICTED: ankyrin repeat domain-containing protein 13C-B [Tarenaya hassleriana]|uniref:ankyrin repeat domain-containing protein 13C-B n=1 Tax=Tarenaya hassleriana TaxID=28532 RepID=UPI00053C558F|nr:PREDICTED: ankyrin repeat domain-containing protein 13C-B [Tarenaya hassleriana]